MFDSPYHSPSTLAHYSGAALSSVFQPIISVAHRRVVGFEALLRGEDRNRGSMNPHELFSLATLRGEQAELDRQALTLHLKTFAESGKDAGWLFLNMHPATFQQEWKREDGLFSAQTINAPDSIWQSLSPNRVVLEVLETSTLNEGEFEAAAAAYKSLGFLVAVDDFGTGESNFERIWAVRPDIVKLDRSILARAGDVASLRIIRHMVALLHQAGAMVVAEGVETLDQLHVLMDADVDLIQGFWAMRPNQIGAMADFSNLEQRLADAWQLHSEKSEQDDAQRKKRLKPLKSLMQAAARHLNSGGSLDEAVAMTFGVDGALCAFVVDANGTPLSPTHFNPRRAAPRDPRFAPVNADERTNRSSRPYFRQAMRHPGRVVLVGPQFSMTEGADCHIAAVSADVDGCRQVLCLVFRMP